MKTGTYNAWWREMGAISRGMMFIEGAIATPLTMDHAEPDASAPAQTHSSSPRNARPSTQKKTFGLYEDLLFLGGRPMTAGHNDDIDEPFPQSLADEPQRPGGQRNRPSQTCATC